MNHNVASLILNMSHRQFRIFVELYFSPPLQHLRYKMVVKLMAEESSATDPTTINMSDYSSISSSEGDYTDIDIDDDYFLFQNVRKLARRKRRKMPPEEYKKNKEKKKLIEYISESDSSSDDDLVYYPQSHPSSAFAEGFQNANYLSDISDDEDAIHINVMRDFTRLENSKMNLKDDDEFSASACQKIHSELMASVNEIYKNLKTKPLLIRNAVSTSSLSNNSTQNFRKLSKSKALITNKATQLYLCSEINHEPNRSFPLLDNL